MNFSINNLNLLYKKFVEDNHLNFLVLDIFKKDFNDIFKLAQTFEINSIESYLNETVIRSKKTNYAAFVIDVSLKGKSFTFITPQDLHNSEGFFESQNEHITDFQDKYKNKPGIVLYEQTLIQLAQELQEPINVVRDFFLVLNTFNLYSYVSHLFEHTYTQQSWEVLKAYSKKIKETQNVVHHSLQVDNHRNATGTMYINDNGEDAYEYYDLPLDFYDLILKDKTEEIAGISLNDKPVFYNPLMKKEPRIIDTETPDIHSILDVFDDKGSVTRIK